MQQAKNPIILCQFCQGIIFSQRMPEKFLPLKLYGSPTRLSSSSIALLSKIRRLRPTKGVRSVWTKKLRFLLDRSILTSDYQREY